MNVSSSKDRNANTSNIDYEEGEIPSEADGQGSDREDLVDTPARVEGNGRSRLFSVRI